MISRNKIKFVTSLHRKKGRDESQCYIAEGSNIVGEMLGTRKRITEIFAHRDWLEANQHLLGNNTEVYEVSRDEMARISTLVTPQDVLCVAEQEHKIIDKNAILQTLSLALDTIQDPGNLGTILRLADWFGIQHVLCSPGCVDVYNPKVVQASMGAICRVNTYGTNLVELLDDVNSENDFNVFGTFLSGENIYGIQLDKKGIIVLGNEGNGISPGVAAKVTRKLLIPSFNPRGAVESLNVSTAAAIICSEFMRR